MALSAPLPAANRVLSLAANPYGIASLSSPAVKSAQDYDISVEISMPRSPSNVERGNFMVRLHLLDLDVNYGSVDAAQSFAENHHAFEGHTILFSSRRPALVPYVDPVVSLASRLLFLPYHVLSSSSQTSSMVVPLAEHVSFPKGSALPASAYLEIEAGQTIQTYEVALILSAQLSGLRWIMFHYRLPTYIIFTFFFWVCEVLFMVAVWGLWTMLTSSPGGTDANSGKPAVRSIHARESHGFGDDELSDGQSGPFYKIEPVMKSELRIKEELERERPLSELPIVGADADDEDEEDEDEKYSSSKVDSGLGTSYSEDGRGSIRRRAAHRQ
jgi:seipin